jgi:tetratricopeptide (TPR) repeat protein
MSCESPKEPTNDVLAELDAALARKDHYVTLREQRIASLTDRLQDQNDALIRLTVLDSLFEEYKSYKYDQAMVYAGQSLDVALSTGDRNHIIMANCNIAFCYISAGLFKEAADVMGSIDLTDASGEVKKEYYELAARLYYDMADYGNGMPFSAGYTERGTSYCDSVMMYVEPGSSDMLGALGLKLMQQRNFKDAITTFQSQLEIPDIDLHTYAIANSCLGYMYWDMGDSENGIHYLALASIGDIRSATKECVALLNLSNILYQTREVDRAIEYARIAMDDANFYNARHRKIQIGTILPIIEREHLARVEGQRNNLMVFGTALSLLCLLLLGATLVIYKQIKSLRRARRTIENQNNKLVESNQIKDEYIVGSLYAKSEYLDRMESLYKTINRKINARLFDDIHSLLKEGDLKKERENMYSSFDETFVRLFPGFIDEYNSLFEEADRVAYNPAKGFTPELRIFALIRLGITDNERIAKFLDYSVNTINTYKTKVKNRSTVPNEQFEQRIMKIKTVAAGNKV